MFLFVELLGDSTNRNNRIKLNMRISHHRLMVDPNISGNLRGLLERGVQVNLDAEEVKDAVLEVAISYTGSLGTSLWSEIKEDRTQVSLTQFFIIQTKADVGCRWTEWIKPCWFGTVSCLVFLCSL